MPQNATIAYFSMEIGVDPGMPTYSGGLGILAGDHVRAAADLGIPLVAVTLLHRKGYFFQQIDAAGRQREQSDEWSVDDFLSPLDATATVTLEGRQVHVGAWEYEVRGAKSATVRVLFLDTDLPQNAPEDRRLTDHLYGGDQRDRLMQEAVLGVGGVRVLRELGYTRLRRFHMNEGHAALLGLELARQTALETGGRACDAEVVEAVRRMCVFTTHTPVEAGHDRFPEALVVETLSRDLIDPFVRGKRRAEAFSDGELNMTHLGLSFSQYINGVAKRHGAVSQRMFTGYAIDSITNGVHAGTWVSPPFAEMLDEAAPGWRTDNFTLRGAVTLDRREVRSAHERAKRRLIDAVRRATGVGLDKDALTLGFGRRATAYKRMDLLLTDPARLKRIAREVGPLQVIFGGKAHPKDEPGKEQIQRVIKAAATLAPEVSAVYMPNYDWETCRLMVAGVDLWLNTPEPPLEASGTSGMKAALNGVPSLSMLDGWWLEGCIEGVTGWAIDAATPARAWPPDPDAPPPPSDSARDAAALYDKLERVIAPLYYGNPDGWADVMRNAMALNGSFFTAQRMVGEYAVKAYLA